MHNVHVFGTLVMKEAIFCTFVTFDLYLILKRLLAVLNDQSVATYWKLLQKEEPKRGIIEKIQLQSSLVINVIDF